MPSAHEAAILKIGISSIILGMIAPPISTPCNEDDLISKSPISSLHSVFWFKICILAPIDFRTDSKPDLVLFNPTFLIKISEFLAIRPATIKNEAEEKSPATL